MLCTFVALSIIIQELIIRGTIFPLFMGLIDTHVHPFSICNLRGADRDLRVDWSEETSKIDIISPPSVTMHMTET